jgi:hypothetical protein
MDIVMNKVGVGFSNTENGNSLNQRMLTILSLAYLLTSTHLKNRHTVSCEVGVLDAMILS